MKLSRAFAFTSCLASCATPATSDRGDPATRARQRVDALVSSGQVPGLQYVVVGPAGVQFQHAAGVQDAANGRPMTSDTLLMAYSTTKVLTAIAVLQLVERGKLELDRPLSAYYTPHPYGPALTIRQLLAHTSGVPDPLPLDWFAVAGQAFDRDQKLQQALADKPRLRHRAGDKYRYSNLGYWLLEKVVEQASGQDFAAYLDHHLFRPLAITPQAARFSLEGTGQVATGHSVRLSVTTFVLRMMTPSAYWSESKGDWSRGVPVVPHGRAYGGLFSSAQALGAVLQDLLRPDSVLLGPAMKKALLDRQSTNDGAAIDSTLGWVLGELEGVPYFGKQGGGFGFHGNLRIYPSRGIATAFLANRTEISPGPIDARSDAMDAPFLHEPSWNPAAPGL